MCLFSKHKFVWNNGAEKAFEIYQKSLGLLSNGLFSEKTESEQADGKNTLSEFSVYTIS